MNKQTITTQKTTLGPGQRLGQGILWIVKQFIQAGLVLCSGAVTYALTDGTAVQGLAIPGMIVVMLLVGRFIYKSAFGTVVVVNTVPSSRQMVNNTNKHDWDDLVTNPVNSHLVGNIWHNTSLSKDD